MAHGSAATTDVTAPAGDDAVRPFAVEALDVRGRAVQMGPELHAILGRHDYPTPVSRLLAETIVLTALLGSSLRIDGRFTVQTETDGPVDMLVVDYRSGGALRAYARYDADKVAEASAAGASPSALLGNGRMAMTVDQGSHATRYQGIVPLDGEDLQEVAHTYFRQSEQIPTRVRLAVAELQERGADGTITRGWRAGGLLVQFLPKSPERARMQELPGGDAPEGIELPEFEEDDAWTEAQALVETVEDVELTDPEVPVEQLLYRLFNQRGVRVFEPLGVRDECSCSSDKVEGVLEGFSAEEIQESTRDGVITATCEFCGRGYAFDPAQFAS